MSTSLPEEYDPKTGQFRPIAPPKPTYGQGSSSEIASGRRADRRGDKPTRRAAPGLSETGQKYGVFYEIFEAAAMTKTVSWMVFGTKIFIALVFLLLLYEAISYRLAQG